MLERPQLALRLFGRFVLCFARDKDAELGVRSKKGAAILAFLALSPTHNATREQLASLLWGNRPDRQARQNLRQCLVGLGRDLVKTPGVLKSTVNEVRLDTQIISIDVEEFIRLAGSDDVSALSRAAELYNGPLLAELDFSDDAFSEWLRKERSRFEALVGNVFSRLVERMDQCGRGVEAIEVAERLIALDPLREDWQRLLLRLLARYHGRSAALDRARIFSEFLQEELDVTPEPETAVLIQEIKRGAVTRLGSNRPLMNGSIFRRDGKVSIAVVPVAATPGDKEMSWLSYSFAQDVADSLTRNRSFLVIMRDTICGGPEDLARVGATIGTDYALTCSVRIACGQNRLLTQLIDSATGVQIWTERHTEDLPAGFKSRDAISGHIAAVLEPIIFAAKQKCLRRRPLSTLDAEDLVTVAASLIRVRTRQNYATAQRLLTRAIQLEPECARAHSLSAWIAGIEVIYGWKSRHHINSVFNSAQKAMLSDDRDPWSHFALGWAFMQRRLPEEAIEQYQAALAINRFFSQAHSCLAIALGYLGRTDRALATLEHNERLRLPEVFLGLNNSARAGVYSCAESPENAIAAARRSIREGAPLVSRRHLIVNCALSGKMEEARAELKQYTDLVPTVSLGRIANALPVVRDTDLNRTLDAFRLVGLR